MSKEGYRAAMNEIRARHDNAVLTMYSHEQEIKEKLPEAARIIYELSQTGLEIFKITQKPCFSKKDVADIILKNKEKQAKLKNILLSNGFPNNYLDIQYSCNKCEDTGYVGNEKCDCLKKLIAKKNVEELQQTCPIMQGSFDDLSDKYYSKIKTDGKASVYDVMLSNISFCKTYSESFEKHSKSILMLGETGLGKTHLSCAIAEVVAKKGYNVFYVSAPDLFRKLQSEYFGGGEDNVSTIDILFNTDLLIIDDLGTEIENQLNTSLFYNIINTRFNSNLPIIISTNLSLKEIEKRYSKRIASRLFTTYKYLGFIGKDIRQQKMLDN